MSVYEPDSWAAGPTRDWSTQQTKELLGVEPEGFTEFLMESVRTSYSGGLLRFLIPGQEPCLTRWNGTSGWSRSWPQWRTRLVVFAYDWLGRLISFDRGRSQNGEPMIGILEPGTAQLLDVPETFAGFIEAELVDFQDAALASPFYAAWLTSGGRAPQVRECVGYKKPLFLGGEDAVGNLDISDLDVYISLCGQLNEQTRRLRRGTRIDGIRRS
jgi:hypothetical protein